MFFNDLPSFAALSTLLCLFYSGNFGTVFVDQSYWQSSVAAKPRQGVWGFLCGGLVWFAVPFTFATTIGMAYLSISSNNRQPLLDSNDVDKGKSPSLTKHFSHNQDYNRVQFVIKKTNLKEK